MTQPAVTNALSFDIEDWFHMVEIPAVENPQHWPGLETIVVRYTREILDILDGSGSRATFFVLGWVAERYPQIVPAIVAAGHEVATHGYWHRKVYEMRPEEFHEDLQHSIDLLASQSGKRVRGFRATSFSITPGTEWAFDVLHDVGIEYDASLFPASRGHGGYPCPAKPHVSTIAPSGRPMPELPMSVMRLGPFRLPFSGGGYLRVLPGSLIRAGFDQLNGKSLPGVVYLHPRDFAPDCPRVPMPLIRRFKCYTGARTTRPKLEMLLRRYRFDTCARVLDLKR